MKKEAFEIPKSKNAGIYMLYNMDKHKAYIGQTTNFSKRATEHKNQLFANSHSNKELQKDVNEGDDFFFVILENMGKACKREDALLMEKKYMLAFRDRCVHLYNRETIEQLKGALFYDMVLPSVNKIQNELRWKFQCHLLSLQRCKKSTLKEKFNRIIEETMERDKGE